MSDASRNFWVGLFVVASLHALGVLMVWFGETPSWLGRGEWTLCITGVRELHGIGEGSPVTLNGVEIGRVQSLDFEDRSRPDRGVEIVARIEKDYRIPRGATAKVYGAVMGFGKGHVAIIVEPGVGGPLLPVEEASIPGEMHSIFGEVISKDLFASVERTVTHIGDLTREWTPVGTNLAEFLEQRPVQEVMQAGAAGEEMTPNISTVVDRLDRLVAHINTILGDENVQQDVKTAMTDLKDITGELKETIGVWHAESKSIADNVNRGVDRTEENLERSFDRLDQILGELNESAVNLGRITHNVAEGNGTAGLLLRDERLYEAAVLALARVGEAMATLQRILGKVEEDGYIVVGKAPTGLVRKRFEIPAKSAESQ